MQRVPHARALEQVKRTAFHRNVLIAAMECSGVWKEVCIWQARFWCHHYHQSAQVDRVQGEGGFKQCGMLLLYNGWRPIERLLQVLHVQDLRSPALHRLLL